MYKRQVISLINLKGGVGKTVSSINIAYSFAELGKKVLIVDTDSQGNISTSLGMDANKLDHTLCCLLYTSGVGCLIAFSKLRKGVLCRVGFNIAVFPGMAQRHAHGYIFERSGPFPKRKFFSDNSINFLTCVIIRVTISSSRIVIK